MQCKCAILFPSLLVILAIMVWLAGGPLGWISSTLAGAGLILLLALAALVAFAMRKRAACGECCCKQQTDDKTSTD
jgi:hypothetical protein